MSRNLGIVVAVVGVILILAQVLHWFEGFLWAGVIALALGILIFFAAGKQ